MSPAWTWLLGGCSLALACGETASSPDGAGGSGGAAAGSSSNAGQSTAGTTPGGSAAGGSSSNGGHAGTGSSGSASGGSASGGSASGGSASAGAGAGGGGSSAGGAGGLVDCDPQKVLCKIVQPECPQGEVPSVKGNCYGDCVKIDRCSCTSAAQCPEPNQYTCLKGPMHCSYFLK